MAPPATRHPLLLPELFELVLDYLDPPNLVIPGNQGSITGIRVHEPSRASRIALFALARTCRALSGPSLDRLWRVLHSFVPLIRCIGEVNGDRTMTPSPDGWAYIARRYIDRVRELCLVDVPGVDCSMDVLQCAVPQVILDRTNRKLPGLFPNLRVLVWDPDVAFDVVPLVRALLTPRLVSFDVSGRLDIACPIFASLLHRCPNITSFRWNCRSYDPILAAVPSLLKFVLDLQNVENLEFFAPSQPLDLKNIILSPKFKVLGIMLDRTLSNVEGIDITPDAIPFPNVETIELELLNLDYLTDLLRPHQQKFRNVTLRFCSLGRRPLVQPMLSCFAALATPQRVNSLRSITFILHHACYWEDETEPSKLLVSPTSYCITFETLSPLASFRCLRKLFVVLHNQISMDDDELWTLARSWPLLEILRLDCRFTGWPWESAKCVTLRGLLALIEACPLLWSICLPIDARNVPTDTNPDVRNTAMQRIEFPDALISEPHEVVEFLHKHLPAVRTVNVAGPASGYEGTVWEGDLDIMMELEERRRLWDEVADLL